MTDVTTEGRPQSVATAQVPASEGQFCDKGGRFGPHNVHEMRPGTLSDPNTIYLTYFNAGLRVVDVSDPTAPREVAYFVPPAPPNRSSIQFNDVLVGANGLIYVTDRYTGGLYILERI